MDEKQRPIPGQLGNCEICSKRFTVTAYSKTGPNGGLLCADCSKEHVDGDKKGPAKKRSSGIGRRQNQSNLLDGLTPHGTQSLLETCIKVRCHHHLREIWRANPLCRKLQITSLTWKNSVTSLLR